MPDAPDVPLDPVPPLPPLLAVMVQLWIVTPVEDTTRTPYELPPVLLLLAATMVRFLRLTLLVDERVTAVVPPLTVVIPALAVQLVLESNPPVMLMPGWSVRLSL